MGNVVLPIDLSSRKEAHAEEMYSFSWLCGHASEFGYVKVDLVRQLCELLRENIFAIVEGNMTKRMFAKKATALVGQSPIGKRIPCESVKKMERLVMGMTSNIFLEILENHSEHLHQSIVAGVINLYKLSL